MALVLTAGPTPTPSPTTVPIDAVQSATDGALMVGAVLVLGLVLLGVLLVRASRRAHRWQVAYWHLAASARCELCGSRAALPAPGLPASRRAARTTTTEETP